MSKVVIITNHAMSEVDEYGRPKEMDAVLFRDKIGYPFELKETNRLLAKILVLKYMKDATESISLYHLLNISDSKEDLPLLKNVVQKVRNFNGMSDRDKYRCDNDLNKGDIVGLRKDIFTALKHIETEDELNIFTSYVDQQHKALCYYKERTEDGENYKIIGISCFPDKGEWMKYSEPWINALIQDFTSPKDEIILALHGATDWKEASPFLGSYPKESKDWSNNTDRRIRIILFNHTDNVGQVLKKDGSSLSDIWNYIDSLWNI